MQRAFDLTEEVPPDTPLKLFVATGRGGGMMCARAEEWPGT